MAVGSFNLIAARMLLTGFSRRTQAELHEPTAKVLLPEPACYRYRRMHACRGLGTDNKQGRFYIHADEGRTWVFAEENPCEYRDESLASGPLGELRARSILLLLYAFKHPSVQW